VVKCFFSLSYFVFAQILANLAYMDGDYIPKFQGKNTWSTRIEGTVVG